MLGAVIVHILGGVARLEVMLGWYGRGDFLRYFQEGRTIASALRRFDTAPFLSSANTWGTSFVERVSGVVLLVVGPSLRAEFVVFSMFPLIGLVLIAKTASRALRPINTRRLTITLFFWPSLVFWPSSIGKESLILLAVGLVVAGWWGNGQKVSWGLLSFGLGLAFLIRPHIAMMIALCVGAADWLAPVERMTTRKVARGLVLLVLAVFVAYAGLAQLGVEANQASIQGFAADRSARTAQGGSRIDGIGGPLLVPMAFVNVLARPFIWEAANPLIALSAVEIVMFWILVWRRRAHVKAMARAWRSSRLLLLLVPLTLVLILFYGAFVSNMGILARQRVIVLPFLFVLAEASQAFRPVRKGSV